MRSKAHGEPAMPDASCGVIAGRMPAAPPIGAGDETDPRPEGPSARTKPTRPAQAPKSSKRSHGDNGEHDSITCTDRAGQRASGDRRDRARGPDHDDPEGSATGRRVGRAGWGPTSPPDPCGVSPAGAMSDRPGEAREQPGADGSTRERIRRMTAARLGAVGLGLVTSGTGRDGRRPIWAVRAAASRR